jgi:hypothetical protein
MIARNRKKQHGATLLIGMVMLVVLTLLVVFSLRSGNTNLRIAGNMQSQIEATAATQQVIEKVIEQIKVTEDLSLIAAQSLPVVMGNVTYTVAVAAMKKCVMDIPVLNSALDPTKANDMPCFENPDVDKAILADGTLSSKPSACKTQQWEIEAGVNDTATGVNTTEVQGISIRVPATVNCL